MNLPGEPRDPPSAAAQSIACRHSASRGTIVYIGRFELPDRNAAAHRVTGNAKIFRDLGFRVVLLGAGRHLPTGSEPVPVQSAAEGVEAWQVNYPEGGAQWLEYIASIRAFERLLRIAEIDDLAMAICYNHPALAQARLFARAKALGAAAVADVTEWYSPQRLQSVRSIIKNADNVLRMRWGNRRADGLIIMSDFVADLYRDMHVPMLRVPTLYPAQPMGETPTRAPADPPRLFFAGTGFTVEEVEASKTGLKDRIDWLVELLAAAKVLGAEFRQTIYGLSRDQFLAILPAHAGLLERLGDWVEFRGRVPHAELLDDLGAADLSIFFRKETRTTLAGFPSKLAESITFGTPVITNPMPSTSPFLTEGRTGFFLDIHDRDQAAVRLKEILSLPPGRIRSMKQACRDSRQFAFETYVEPTRAWLERLFPLDDGRSVAGA